MKRLTLGVILFCLTVTSAFALIEKYEDVVQSTSGPVVSRATISVYSAGTTSLVSLYTSTTGTASLANPVTTDTSGRYWFYVNEGYYDLAISKTGYGSYTRSNVKVGSAALSIELSSHESKTGNQAHGLGTISTQNSNAVAITGGTASGIVVTNSTLSGDAISGNTTINTARPIQSALDPGIGVVAITGINNDVGGTGIIGQSGGVGGIGVWGIGPIGGYDFYGSGPQSYFTGSVSFAATTNITDLVTGVTPVVDVRSIGTFTANGTTDNSAAIQAAIEKAHTAKTNIVSLPAGTIAIASTIDIPYSNIMLVGQGADSSHDIGTVGGQASTVLKWTGAAGGTMVAFRSPEGASNQKMNGGGIENIYFQANGAAYGIRLQSRNSTLISRNHGEEFSTAFISLESVNTLGEAKDTQNNMIIGNTGRQLLTNGALIMFDGVATANSSINYAMNNNVSFKDGDAFVFFNSDNNRLFANRATRSGGGSGNAIVFHGSNAGANQVARGNVFYGFTSNNAPIVGKGTDSYTYASYDNAIYFADSDNSTPAPTLGTGSTVWFSNAKNAEYDKALVRAGMGDLILGAREARDGITTETLRIKNLSDNHVRLYDVAGNEWGINIDSATGNLRIGRTAGTGNFQVTGGSGLMSALTLSTATTQALFELRNLTGSADINRWQLVTNASGDLILRGLDDGGTGSGNTIVFTRSTNNIDNVKFKTNTGVLIGDSSVEATTAGRKLHVEKKDTGTNTVLYPARFSRTTSNTPAIGIGTGIELSTETTASFYRVGSTIDSVSTDVTNSAENFDLVFQTMQGGTLAERFRISGTQATGILSGTTNTFGGSSLASIGTCTSGTASITGATTSMTAIAQPSDGVIEDNVVVKAYVSGAGTVTVKECALAAVTPASRRYFIRVIK